MASKQKLNGFSLFMRERRNALETDGQQFPGGWKDVANKLDDGWKSLSEDERDSYRQRAKKMTGNEGPGPSAKPTRKSAPAGYDGRRTSHGVSYQELKDKKEQAFMRQLDHHAELKLAMEHSDPKEMTFVIINFSIYGCLLNKLYVPAEVGLTAFNVQEGIIDNYGTLIDPYHVPTGMGVEARNNAEKLAVPFPPFDNRRQNYEEIVAIIEKFVDRHTPKKATPKTWKMYCLTHEMTVNNGCLEWLYSQIPHKKNRIELFSLGEAVRMLSSIGVANRARRENRPPGDIINDLIAERSERDSGTEGSIAGCSSSGYGPASSHSDIFVPPTPSLVSTGPAYSILHGVDFNHVKAGVFFHERQVEEFLDSLNFAFDGEVGCIYHLNKDEALNLCALNVTNRYAYNILDVMVTTFGVDAKMHFHYPGLRINPVHEADRRNEMLILWGEPIYNDEDLNYDARQKDPRTITVYPEFGPSRPK